MSATRATAPLIEVKGTTPQGRRVYLDLACGHRVLHQTRNPVPKRAYCFECGDATCAG